MRRRPRGISDWSPRPSRPTGKFQGETNSDLAFTGTYVIQGNYNGFQVWDISNPRQPTLKTAYVCPASQSDVSVYKNLLFVSAEGTERPHRLRRRRASRTPSARSASAVSASSTSATSTHPKNVANVQTCRGSHTHTLLVDPKDQDNVYIYVSGSAASARRASSPAASARSPDQDPNSALFRIEVIKVPLAHPGAGRDRELARASSTGLGARRNARRSVSG